MVTRGHSDPKPCPVPRCPRTVPSRYLMCGAHWHQVPRDLRVAVWGAWRRWERSGSDEDWTAYLLVREDALDAAQGATHGH